MLIVGRLVGRVDTRLLIAIGLGLTAWSFSAMTGWTPDVSRGAVIGVGVVQGVGLSFLSVPVNSVTLSSLSSEARAEGAGFTTLMRNLGSSVGIAVVNAFLTRNTQVNHAAIALHVTAVLQQSRDTSNIGQTDAWDRDGHIGHIQTHYRDE
jgi:DHA2 family multidrug resistance protein